MSRPSKPGYYWCRANWDNDKWSIVYLLEKLDGLEVMGEECAREIDDYTDFVGPLEPGQMTREKITEEYPL